MAVARTTCLRCCLDVAEGQHIADGLEACGRCNQPITAQCIPVGNTGLASLRQTLFNRLRAPRPLSTARAMVANICWEQFQRWISPTWRHVSSKKTAKEDREVYVLLEWADVKELCHFEEVARGTMEPSQGRGNIRASAYGGLGIIVPPVVVTHRCCTPPKHFPSLTAC